MIARRVILSACVGLGLCGCGSEAATEPPDDEEPVEAVCEVAELTLPDGTCLETGIGSEACAEGFEHDGDHGCEPVLPEEPCGPGLMAIPGETACRAVAPCGDGPWGDLPIDGDTVYVDAAFGSAGDGSESSPFTTIGEALAAAAPGALIAVAEGRYDEDLSIGGKAVRLWGRCPDLVEIAGLGSQFATVLFTEGAHGSEVGGVAITGPGTGIALSGSLDVLVDRVWVHEAGGRGIEVSFALGATSARIVDALLENNHEVGLFVTGAEASVERVVVRGTAPPTPTAPLGHGMLIQSACPQGLCDPTAPSVATVSRSVLELNHDAALVVAGSEATLEGSVVRDTQPNAADQSTGIGLQVQLSCDPSGCDLAGRSTVAVRGSLLDGNLGVGMLVTSSDATVDDTVVRHTLPRPSDDGGGRGIATSRYCTDEGCDPAGRSSLTLRGALVANNHESGVLVSGADATLERVVVRDTAPRPSDQWGGVGLGIQSTCLQIDFCDPTTSSVATVQDSLIERSYVRGVTVADSEATLERVIVRATETSLADGSMGDGLAVLSLEARGQASLTNLRVEQSARAAVASFGADVSIGTSQLQCALFPLNGEVFLGHAFTFDDRGENTCGCPTADGDCKVLSAGLQPPQGFAVE